MKEKFINKNFRPESLALLEHITTILSRYQAQGYDLSVRQLYYQLVTINAIPNTLESYGKVQSLVSDARLAGLIDWEMIKDRGRITHDLPVYKGLPDFLNTYMEHFRLDCWDNQPYHIEVMVEKQALEGVLQPICQKLRVPFTANKGYSSQSTLYETGKRIQTEIVLGKKKAVVLYLGDHDPSGIDMVRDVQDRLTLFAMAPVEVKRIALNMEQIEEYNPPENPAKQTDSRFAAYQAEFGDSSWELDALPPDVLANLVTTEVLKYVDQSRWSHSLDKEEEEREELQDIINTLE